MVGQEATLEGVQGSYTWSGRAVDRLVEVPAAYLPVDNGEVIRFVGEGPAADEVYLTAFSEEAVADRSLRATKGLALDPMLPTWRVELPGGRYVLGLARTWHETENVIHYFGISVAPGGGR